MISHLVNEYQNGLRQGCCAECISVDSFALKCLFFVFFTIFYHGKILSRFVTGKKSDFLPVKNPFYITSPVYDYVFE